MELTNSKEQSPAWDTTMFSGSQNIFPHFMERGCSLPCLQKPAKCHYPESRQFGPQTPILFLEEPF
jgi:hypothetical protein